MSAINEACAQAVDAAGGPAEVGRQLWPLLAPKHATRRVSACLASTRLEKFSPDEFLHVLKLARSKGHTAGIRCLLEGAGYDPIQILAPRDEVADLQREYIQTVRQQQAIAERMERAAGRVSMRAVG